MPRSFSDLNPLGRGCFQMWRRQGFTLMELLAAFAVLMILTVVLGSLLSHSSRLWRQGENQNQHRLRVRAALEFIGREMHMAVLSPDPGDANTLQFVINPPSLGFHCRDTVFWQAPIAQDATQGNLAAVGYFVRWTPENRALLCRFFLNPSDPGYSVYTPPFPSAWVSEELLDTVAPADKASQYQGLFLENVLGLWVTAYDADGNTYASGYDSRAEGNRLPARAVISLVLIDNETAERLKSRPALASSIQGLYTGSQSAEAFLSSAILDPLRSGAAIASFTVNFANAR